MHFNKNFLTRASLAHNVSHSGWKKTYKELFSVHFPQDEDAYVTNKEKRNDLNFEAFYHCKIAKPDFKTVT